MTYIVLIAYLKISIIKSLCLSQRLLVLQRILSFFLIIIKSLCMSQRLLVLQRILSFFSYYYYYYYYCYKYEPTITVIKAITNAHFEAQFNSAYAPFGILGINNFSKSVSKGGDFLFI